VLTTRDPQMVHGQKTFGNHWSSTCPRSFQLCCIYCD